jgi:ArsR family metal-binding transcriptional regulator
MKRNTGRDGISFASRTVGENFGRNARDDNVAQKELQDLRVKIEQAQQQCEANSRSLEECKVEVLRLQTQVAETRECLHQDFEQFWMTVMKHSQAKAIHSTRPQNRPPPNHVNSLKSSSPRQDPL